MSSANKRKDGSLEDAFRHRMQDAEATPAPDLWDRIDHDLTVQENVQYKNRVVFYRQLAAACFILFVMAGAVLLYQFNTPGSTKELAQQELQPKTGKDNLNNSEQVSEAIADNKTVSPETTDHIEEQINSAALRGKDRTTGTSGYKAPVIAQNTTLATTKQDIALSSGSESSLTADFNKTETGNIFQNSSADRPTTAQFVVTRALEEQKTQPNSFITPSSILQTPSVLSLMAKDQQKLADFSSQNKPDALQQVKALAQELNEGTKADDKSDKTADSRWSMSMAYTPTYFAQNIGLPDQMMGTITRFSLASSGPVISAETSANMEKARDEYENNTTPAFSYAVDVKAGFKLGQKLNLLAGFGYSQNTTRTNTSYVVEQFWNNPKTNAKVELTPSTIFLPSLNNSFTTDSISVSATDPFDVDYRYRMVSIPIGLQYEHGISNGWNLYMAGGIAANIMVQSSVSSSREDIVSVSYDQDDESPFRNTHFSGNVGLGISKEISDAVSVSVGPEFRSFFNTMLAEPDKAVATQGKPYSIGLNMSLNYQLGSAKK